MHPGDPGRGPGEASAASSTPGSGKMGCGKSCRLSPCPPPVRNTQHRLTRATPNRGSCRAPQSQAAHKAPPAHTQHSRSRRAHPHNRTARTPPRPLAGVPASPAPGSALRAHPHRETQPDREEGTRSQPGRCAPRPALSSLDAPQLTRTAAQQQAQRPQQPHGAAAAPTARRRRSPRGLGVDPAPRHAGHAHSLSLRPPPRPPLPGPTRPRSVKFCKRPGGAPPPASCPGCPGLEKPSRGLWRVRPLRPLAASPLWLRRSPNNPSSVLSLLSPPFLLPLLLCRPRMPCSLTPQTQT